MATQVESYETSGGRDPVKEYIFSCDPKTIKRIVKNLDRLEMYGFGLLGSGIFSKIVGHQDLYELKIKFNKMEHRIMCGKAGSIIYLLDGFHKKENKLRDTDIQRSQDRLIEVKRLKGSI